MLDRIPVLSRWHAAMLHASEWPYDKKPMPEFTTILIIGCLVGLLAFMSIALLPARAGDKGWV